MDGPAISGGGGGVEIAAGYVVISADLSALRAAEQEAKDIVARIGGMNANANIGGASGSIANPTNGGGGFVLSLKIDENALRTQLESFQRTIAPIRVPVEYVASGSASLPNELPAAAASPMQRMSRRGNSEADQILGAMERNLADAAARGDAAEVARFQGIINSFGGSPATVASPATIAGNPWTTAAAGFAGGSANLPFASPWTTAAAMQAAQKNPWTTAAPGASAGLAFASPWTTATQIFGPPRPPTYFNTAADEAILMRAFDEEMEDQEEDERYGLNRQRTRRTMPGSVGRASLSAFRRSRNPFSIYGIGTQLGARFGGIGTGIAVAFAAEAGLRLGSGLIEAGYEGENYEKYLTSYQFSGADTSQFFNPARDLASRQAAISRADAFESIPLLGSVIRFGDELTGLAAARRMRLQNAQRTLEAEVGLEQGSFQARVSVLDTQGRSVEAARLEADRSNTAAFNKLYASPEFARLGGLEAERTGAAASSTEWQQYYDIERANRVKVEQAKREQDAEILSLRDRGRIGAMQASAYTASVQFNAPLNPAEQAALNEFTMIHGQYTERGRLAIEQFQREQRPGAIIAQQQVEMEALKSKQFAEISAVNPGDPRLPGIVAAAAGDRQALEAKQAAERIQISQDTEARITQLTLQGEAARLAGQRDAFGSRMAILRSEAEESERAAYRGLLAAPRSNPQQIAQAYREYGAVFEANMAAQDGAGQAHRRELADMMGQGQANIAESFSAARAAELRMSGDEYAAGFQRFVAERAVLRERMRQAQANPSIIQSALQTASVFADQSRIEAEQREYQFNYQRNVAEEQFGFSSRFQAAEFALHDEPIAARAEQAVARARLEYEQLTRQTNDPKRLLGARRALEEELRAQRHELVEQRSGDVALNMSFAEAMNIPTNMSLNLHQEDIRAASGVFAGGIAAVRSGQAIPGMPQVSNGGGADMAQLVTDAKQVIDNFAKAVVKFANAKGVALFGG